MKREVSGSTSTTAKKTYSRSSRACKDTAKALLALVVADENFKFDKQFGSITSPPSNNTNETRKKSTPKEINVKIKQRNTNSINNIPILSLDFVTKSTNYVCLSCTSKDGCDKKAFTFEDYSELMAHKQLRCKTHAFTMNYTRVNAPPDWEINYSYLYRRRHFLPNEESAQTYDNFLSNAVKHVPESSFNHLHGTIHHINSLDGNYLRKNPKIRTVNRVKLNLSGSWGHADVWNSAWEFRQHRILSWTLHMLKSMSVMGWNEQLLVQKSLLSVSRRGHSSNHHSNGTHSHSLTSSPSSGTPHIESKIELRRRVQRLLSSLHLKPNSKFRPPVTRRAYFSGEWTLRRIYVCSVCSQTFDDLEDVMHHKWEMHPYCLVSHFTLLDSILLPAHQMYPSRTAVPDSTSDGKMCSKCNKNTFQNEEFYIHLLTCGGDLNEDSVVARSSYVYGGVRKRRKRSSGVVRSSVDDELRRVERERRKRRLEMFSKPRPPTERLTRLQLKSNSVSATVAPTVPKVLKKKRKDTVKVTTTNYSPPEGIIIDLFNPGEILVKLILDDVISRVFEKGGRGLPVMKRRGRPPGRRRRRKKRRKNGIVQSEDNSSNISSSGSTTSLCDPPFFAKKSCPSDDTSCSSTLVFAKKSIPVASDHLGEIEKGEDDVNSCHSENDDNEFVTPSSQDENGGEMLSSTSAAMIRVNIVEGNTLFSL